MRVQLEFSPSRVNELESLMAETGIVTKKELFNNALTLFEWAIEERRHGHVVGSLDESSSAFREVVLPCFTNVQPWYGRDELSTVRSELSELFQHAESDPAARRWASLVSTLLEAQPPAARESDSPDSSTISGKTTTLESIGFHLPRAREEVKV